MARTMYHLRTPEDVRAFAAERGYLLVETDRGPYVKLPGSPTHPSATVGDTILDNGADAETPFEVYKTALHWLLDPPE